MYTYSRTRSSSKSYNAIEAEKSGRFPATTWVTRFRRKGLFSGITVQIIKDVVQSSEWHHTSKFANATTYYSIENIYESRQELREAIRQKKETKHIKLAWTKCSVRYLDWGGTRKHPKSIEVFLTDCLVIQTTPKTVQIFTSKSNFSKRIDSNGFSFTHGEPIDGTKLYDDRIKREQQAIAERERMRQRDELDLKLNAKQRDFAKWIAEKPTALQKVFTFDMFASLKTAHIKKIEQYFADEKVLLVIEKDFDQAQLGYIRKNALPERKHFWIRLAEAYLRLFEVGTDIYQMPDFSKNHDPAFFVCPESWKAPKFQLFNPPSSRDITRFIAAYNDRLIQAVQDYATYQENRHSAPLIHPRSTSYWSLIVEDYKTDINVLLKAYGINGNSTVNENILTHVDINNGRYVKSPVDIAMAVKYTSNWQALVDDSKATVAIEKLVKDCQSSLTDETVFLRLRYAAFQLVNEPEKALKYQFVLGILTRNFFIHPALDFRLLRMCSHIGDLVTSYLRLSKSRPTKSNKNWLNLGREICPPGTSLEQLESKLKSKIKSISA
jgi:hypothetical protein